jgi:hypothetical protein
MARRKGGPILPQLPEVLRPVLASYPPNLRVALQRMYRHGGEKFIEWLAGKVKAGEISTDVPDRDSIWARTFIRELHSSFDGRHWLISVRDRKDFDQKHGPASDARIRRAQSCGPDGYYLRSIRLQAPRTGVHGPRVEAAHRGGCAHSPARGDRHSRAHAPNRSSLG